MPQPFTLTPRERVRLALEHRQTDRVPMSLICAGINRPAWEALDAYLHTERQIDVDTYLAGFLDILPVGPKYIGPALAPGMDIWGVHRAPLSYGADSYEEIDHYPLAAITEISELDRYPWPQTDWFDYTVIPRQIAAAHAGGYATWAVGCGNIFESSWYMRGFEQLFVDLLDAPELAHALFARVTDFCCAHYREILTAARGEIELAFTADDIGGQQGLLMAYAMWREFLQPYHTRLNAVIHEYGTRVIYHSDGAVMEAVPGLLDMGIDVLQALQFDAAGMDPALLKSQYGSRLCFEGGVSVQHTLPFGTPEEVRAEVRHLIDTLGAGGGYILGPAHCIQAGTPPENIVAMFEEAGSV